MIALPPCQLFRSQQRQINQILVDRRKSQRFEAEESTLSSGNLAGFDQHQILDPDAISPGLVIAWLVGQDHPRQQFLLASGLSARCLGDPLRPFVDREEAADTVAGAMGIIEARSPQMLAGEAIELAAGRPLRKSGAGERDMALQDAGEAILLLGGRFAGADPDGPGDIGRPIGILPARIDQIDTVRRDGQA